MNALIIELITKSSLMIKLITMGALLFHISVTRVERVMTSLTSRSSV